MNGMDEAQAKINEAMRGPPDPDSPAALRAEIARLRKGIQDYLDGDYENARQHRGEDPRYTCEHGRHYWEDCGECIDEHFQLLLDGASLSNGERDAG